MKDHYQILEVEIDASQEAIKEQYRFLVQAWHPDKFPNSAQKLRAEEKLKDINAAYEVLRNPVKRTEYDNLVRYKYSNREEGYREPKNPRQPEDQQRKKEEAERRAKEELRKERVEREQREAEKRRAVRAKKIPTGHHDWIVCSKCKSNQYYSSVKCNNCGSKFD